MKLHRRVLSYSKKFTEWFAFQSHLQRHLRTTTEWLAQRLTSKAGWGFAPLMTLLSFSIGFDCLKTFTVLAIRDFRLTRSVACLKKHSEGDSFCLAVYLPLQSLGPMSYHVSLLSRTRSASAASCSRYSCYEQRHWSREYCQLRYDS